MMKKWITKHWEQDWDNENMYYKVGKDGVLVKVDVEEWKVYKYPVEKVVH